jgi:UDP-N-acetyl-D-glucosamine dehydrogenase
VDYHDPHVPATHKMRQHDLQMKSITLSPETIRAYDCVVVATHHSAYDWQQIADNAQLIVDTRNAMRNVKGRRDHIVQA